MQSTIKQGLLLPSKMDTLNITVGATINYSKMENWSRDDVVGMGIAGWTVRVSIPGRVRPTLGSTKPLEELPRVASQRGGWWVVVKGPGRKAECSPPSSAEGKNKWSYMPSTPYDFTSHSPLTRRVAVIFTRYSTETK
jgi:hypothetical protein